MLVWTFTKSIIVGSLPVWLKNRLSWKGDRAPTFWRSSNKNLQEQKFGQFLQGEPLVARIQFPTLPAAPHELLPSVYYYSQNKGERALNIAKVYVYSNYVWTKVDEIYMR